MVTVTCIKNYQDLKLNKRVTIGEQFEVSNDRAKQLEAARVAEVVKVAETTPTTPKEVAKPKKSRAKKEA